MPKLIHSCYWLEKNCAKGRIRSCGIFRILTYTDNGYYFRLCLRVNEYPAGLEIGFVFPRIRFTYEWWVVLDQVRVNKCPPGLENWPLWGLEPATGTRRKVLVKIRRNPPLLILPLILTIIIFINLTFVAIYHCLHFGCLSIGYF